MIGRCTDEIGVRFCSKQTKLLVSAAGVGRRVRVASHANLHALQKWHKGIHYALKNTLTWKCEISELLSLITFLRGLQVNRLFHLNAVSHVFVGSFYLISVKLTWLVRSWWEILRFTLRVLCWSSLYFAENTLFWRCLLIGTTSEECKHLQKCWRWL